MFSHPSISHDKTMAKEFEQMKLMKKIVDYMRSESIISTQRAKRLKTDIRKWWFIKTKQSETLKN